MELGLHAHLLNGGGARDVSFRNGCQRLTFHITGSNPLHLADVLREFPPMSGVSIEADEAATPPSPAANAIMRPVQHYMPYFGVSRRFDQSNLRAGLGPARYGMDVEKLRRFLRSYVGKGAPA